jgi:hypothetical protein
VPIWRELRSILLLFFAGFKTSLKQEPKTLNTSPELTYWIKRLNKMKWFFFQRVVYKSMKVRLWIQIVSIFILSFCLFFSWYIWDLPGCTCTRCQSIDHQSYQLLAGCKTWNQKCLSLNGADILALSCFGLLFTFHFLVLHDGDSWRKKGVMIGL